MKKATEFCLKNPWVTTALAVAALVAAAAAFRGLPVDVLPEIRVPRVVVQTEAGGMTAGEVEQFVTAPIEAAVRGLPGVRDVRSSSGGGLSFVWVDFDWDADLFRARLGVSEKLAGIHGALPAEAEPEITPVVSVSGEIMMVAITVDPAFGGGELEAPPTLAFEGELEAPPTLADLRQLAEFELRNRLLAVPGIGQVVVLGGELPEMRVSVSQERLEEFGLALDDVVEAVGASRTLAGAGYLADSRGREIPLRQAARADTAEDLRRAVVPAGTGDGRALALGDLAEVSVRGAPRRGSAGYNGEDAVVLAVQKMPGGNTLDLTREIDAVLDAFEATRLPRGAVLHRDAYRQSEFIEMSITRGRRILRDAALIVVLVLALTMMRARTTLVALLSIPLSLAAGVLFFPRLGLGLNIMTLGGLAIAVGSVVDNTIIFVELAWRRLDANAALPGASRQTKPEVLRGAGAEVFGPVTFSTLIIVVVFLPMLFLTGIEGQFFKPLAAAFLLVFAASLVVSLTITPVLCLLLHSGRRGIFGKNGGCTSPCTAPAAARGDAHPPADVDSVATRLLKRLYAPALRFCLRRAWWVCGAMAALAALMLALAATFGTSFLPPFHENCYTVFINTPPGTSLEETERATREATRMLAEVPGVLGVTRRTGRAERDEHAEPVSTSELVVRVDMSADPRRVRAGLESIVHGLPGVSTLIGYPIAHRVSAVLSGASAELAVNLYGDDLAALRQAAARAAEILATLPQVADAQANREVLVDTLRIRYRMADLASAGLTLRGAGEQVSAAFNGFHAGVITQNENRLDLMVRLEDAERAGPADVAAFKLSTPSGARVRLDEVADVFREEASNLIVRDNGRRKALISCNAAPGSNTGDLVAALRKHLEPAMREFGCVVGYGGSHEARQSAARRLSWAGAAVAVCVLLLLAWTLRGFRHALLVLVNIPLGLVGGVFALYMAAPGSVPGNTLALFGRGVYVSPVVSVSAIIGFVTATGFVVRNGLLLINKYNGLRASGLGVDEAVERGSVERMAPVIMTSLTTILGLLPLVLAHGKPGGELLAPLAVVQFGGLVSATLLNLLVLPAAYRLAEGRGGTARAK